ncbi:MAG: fumarylacetoacetate hydrolase family protein [Rhodospirillaceae bacterium]|nr:fumarylacetoacetate hydrolase family protein [Rhodospirillaceae bacterium]
MRLLTFKKNGTATLGVVEVDGQTIIDLSVAAPDLPQDMNSFIELGNDGLKKAAAACDKASDDARLKLADLELLAPIPNPRRNVMCVGRNYHEHAQEFHDSGFDATAGATAVPDDPIIFTKATTSVSGPSDPIPAHLDSSNSTDYEGELAVIIGKEGRGISKADAFDYVFGYTVSNDVTARTQQHKHKQWFIGKSLDGYCPMGPMIVTADEAGHPDTFHLKTVVNGETRQDASVADLIFDIPTLIECISAGITLKPGDIIATGTPVGVGIGFEPPVFLKKGDVVEVTIEPIGTIRNEIE